MKTQKVKISEVKMNPNNPRLIKDDKFAKLVRSIKEFPKMLEIRPIVVNAEMIVLGGNMRLKACKEAGLKEVTIIFADDLTEDEQKQFIIKDNVGFGEWDWEQLANEWDEVQLQEWGLDIPDFGVTELTSAEEDDYEMPDELHTDIVLGDLFEIGDHRLLCGDSTDSDAVAKLMDGKIADMVFTDPPYGVSYKSNHRSKNSKTQFDVLQNDDKFLDFKSNLILFSTQSSPWFIWTSHQVYPIWREMYDDFYINTIIWDKGKMSMGDLESYGNNYEMALFCSQGKPKLKQERKPAIWKLNVESGSEYMHPTQKPVNLAGHAIPDFTIKNDLILDLFLGSGSTMAASHQLKRKCYGMELDPKYCQVIVDRMRKLDPDIVILKNGLPL